MSETHAAEIKDLCRTSMEWIHGGVGWPEVLLDFK